MLRVDRSAEGKNGQKVRGQAPYVDPAPEKWGSIDPLDPVAPRPLVTTIFDNATQELLKDAKMRQI